MPKKIECPFLVVIPFCSKETALVKKNLDYWKRLDGRVPYEALFAWDTATPESEVKNIIAIGNDYFSKVHTFYYEAPIHASWPRPQNAAFQESARYISMFFNCPWLWLEPDTVALRPNWLRDLVDEYNRGQKPFMGHIVAGMGHMNGVGFYPNQIEKYAPAALMTDTVAWDVAMKDQMIDQCHPANDLMQHMWDADPSAIMKQWSKGGEITFPNWESVAHRVDFKKAILHRCKDGTLIDRISEHNWGGKTAAQVNIPDHTGTQQKTVTVHLPTTPPDASAPSESQFPVQPVIVTYSRDLPWLEYCLRAMKKFTSGFMPTLLVIPRHEDELFRPLFEKYKYETAFFDEIPGKGMLHHMWMIFSSDKRAYRGAKYIMHLDADCIFRVPTRPEDYFSDGKPHYLVRTYDSLTNAQGVVSDCAQWQSRVESALGYVPRWYTMCRHPTLFHVEHYAKLREAVEKHNGKPCEDVILSGRNEFPQSFAEFPTMGAWATENARDDYFWIDCSNGMAPYDRMKVYWSHGGLEQMMPSGKTARQEMEEILK